MIKHKKIYCLLGMILLLVNVYAFESAYGEKVVGETYEVSRSKINRLIGKGTIFNDYVEIKNTGNSPLSVSFSVKGEISDIISYKTTSLIVEPENLSRWEFSILGQGIKEYIGEIDITGDIVTSIETNLTVMEETKNPDFLIDINLQKSKFILTEKISFRADLTRLKPIADHNFSLTYFLISPDNQSLKLETENLSIENSLQLLKQYTFSKGAKPGFYIIRLETKHGEETLISQALVEARISFFQRKLFGIIPFWVIFLGIVTILVGTVTFYLIRRHILSKRKYKMTLDLKTLPKKDKKFLWLGKVAEKTIPAYLDPHRLTVHSIVAGATGGGKSIAAQVIIEEALKQNISVMVFDPTAQWSGMLRKCTDKKMFAYYKKFGMKTTDSRGFPGNIRAIKDARQVIDIEKYFEPGHINIFTLNKLQPKDMDIFVANVIRGIFESDPKEFPTLRTLLVFDEVHRLLPKFGGSGEGFVQIERACREFRKWGYGVMLVSQVLSDFVGEIKANISTEVQMRTRDEGDLGRIKTKFGDEFLQSLVKASVGVGMFVNPSYNHANPYFVNFRPILHNTRRLPDEELEKYNEYNDQVDDLEYQIEQLETEKVDVFDLKMEVKLVKDKIMVGNFSVVDIYLEGLKPRVAKQWEKLGKKPKKKQIQLADLDAIKKSVEEAKKESEKAKANLAAAEKKEEKKVDPMEELENKIVTPLTLDNGAMISSLKELKEVLPNVDDEIFKLHVNVEKNDIAKWFEQISKVYAARLKSVIEKPELIKQINDFKLGEPKAPLPVAPKSHAPKPKSSANPPEKKKE